MKQIIRIYREMNIPFFKYNVYHCVMILSTPEVWDIASCNRK